MPDGEDYNLFSVEVIQRDISSLAELNHPFAKLGRQLVDGTSHMRVPGECFNSIANRLHGTLGGVRAFGYEKTMEPGNVAQCRF